MAKKRYIVISMLGSILLSSASFAQDDGDDGNYAREGGYVGLGAVYVSQSVDEDDIEGDLESELARAGFPGVKTSLDVDDTWGLNARVGARFGSRVAMEVVGDWFDDVDVDIDTSVPGASASLEAEAWAVTYNLKGYVLTGRAQPYAVVGGGLFNVDIDSSVGSEDEHGFSWRLGGGLDFYQTENIVLNLEALYYLPTGDVRDFDFVSVGFGVQYRF